MWQYSVMVKSLGGGMDGKESESQINQGWEMPKIQ